MQEKPVLWESAFTVGSHDTDYMNGVRPSALLRYLQETSNLEHRFCGPDLYRLRDENKIAFILSKVSMKISGAPAPFEELRVQSWYAGSRGFSFLRCGRVFHGDELICEMHSVWALTDITDPTDRKLLRADTLELGFGAGEPLSLGFPPRMRFPADPEGIRVGQKKVLYADCDLNRHMNNTHYPDLFLGFAGDLDGKRAEEIEISYLSEAPLGEELTVFRTEKDGDLFFRSVRASGAVNAEARIRLTQREHP